MRAKVNRTVPTQTPPSYRRLVADIARLYENARRTLAEIYWNIGRRIVEIEQDGAVRARYGQKLLENLSRDLCRRLGRGFSVANLRKMRQLYLTHPKRLTSTELDWSRQVALLPVKRAKLRARLEKQAVRGNLSSRQLRMLVRAESKPQQAPKPLSRPAATSLLVPKKGKVGIYRIVAFENALHCDLGFSTYRELSEDKARVFNGGDFVKVRDRDSLEKISDGRPSDLYTYEADLIRAIDADTFWMQVWIARPEWRKEKLRLRGIDAPELGTPEGRVAKRVVEGLFKKAQAVTVTTTQLDKYRRYLSDVFLVMADGKEIFLNNFLLEKGYAVRADEIPASEWEKE